VATVRDILRRKPLARKPMQEPAPTMAIKDFRNKPLDAGAVPAASTTTRFPDNKGCGSQVAKMSARGVMNPVGSDRGG